MDATGKVQSSMLVCRIYRDSTSVEDSFVDFAALLEVDFHYQINSFGSALEYAKDIS
jgi:hypothetical protein